MKEYNTRRSTAAALEQIACRSVGVSAEERMELLTQANKIRTSELPPEIDARLLDRLPRDR